MNVSSRVLVNSIIADLSDRKGLGDAWDEIDDDVKERIAKDWTRIIETPDEREPFKLVPITTRVYQHVMAMAFKWFCGWQWQLPFVIMSRQKLESWTHNACDHAVYRTARVFRGKELP